jgi:flagellar protein FliS
MSHPYGANNETRILSATPLELVAMLYEAAISEIRQARRHLAASDVEQRARCIIKAVDILGELAHSLDHQTGGELSAHLAALYDYTQRLLLDANFRQVDGPLAEAVALLEPLSESWHELARREYEVAMPAALSA